MTSFDYRLNPIYAIKECSTCGVLYTADFCCSKKGFEDKILVPKPLRNCARCARCGTPVDGPYCQGVLFSERNLGRFVTFVVENEFFKDLQDYLRVIVENTNVVNVLKKPLSTIRTWVSIKTLIIFPQNFTSFPNIILVVKICGGPHENFSMSRLNEKAIISEQNLAMILILSRSRYTKEGRKKSKLRFLIRASRLKVFDIGKIPICYDDDEDDTIAITPVLPIKEPDNSLSMGDEHLDTIPAMESDEVIKSSVEDLVPIPSESEGIPDKMCDVPLCENTTPLNALNEHSEIVVNSDDDNSSSDDDYPYGENIDYVDALSPDVEIDSLEVVEIVDPEVGRIDDDILLTIKDDIIREKLLNVNLLIAKIDALRDNPTPSSEVVIKSTSTFPNLFLEETNTFDNSIPESETFRFNLEEISSGSPTTHSELSLPDYKAFYVDNDHFKERSSGSTTTHVDFSQYDSFIFDLSNDQFPPADRSDFNHEEFADELTHIMSLPFLLFSFFFFPLI
ncbi:hypothetical protein Tco_0209081 [Tanacetum coccineum]